MIISQFYIKVLNTGEQIPEILIAAGIYEKLSYVSSGGMSYSKVIKREVDNIKLIVNGLKERHFIGYDEFIYLSIFKDITKVTNGIGDEIFKPFEVPTDELLDLLIRWYQFLCVYENNGIPDLTYNRIIPTYYLK